MSEHTVLLVDDEPNVLQGYQRALRKRFRLETALCSEEALTAVNFLGPFAVIVSDMNMPRENGVQLLQKIIARSPDSVRIMLTGNADQQTAVDAVNLGGVFRFLNKPCSPEQLGDALQAGIDEYIRRRTEQQLIAETVNGVVRLLCDVLGVANPAAFGRGSRLKRLMSELAAAARLPEAWPCEMAAMLSQIAFVAGPQLPGLGGGEWDPYALAARWIAEVPRLHEVAEIVGWQGSSVPENEQPPLAARLLRIARVYDELIEEDFTPALAIAQLATDDEVDEQALSLLAGVVDREPQYELRQCPANDMPIGSLLAADVLALDGRLLVKAGQEITPSLRIHLQQHATQGCLPAYLGALTLVEAEPADAANVAGSAPGAGPP